jgi:hypothetical protein
MALSCYATSVVYGKILTRPAVALTSFERVSLVGAVLLAAAFAATLKSKNAIVYGHCELGFALAVTWALVSSQMRAEPVANGLALMAAVYLTSRAFLNIVDAFRQQAAARARVADNLRACQGPDRQAALQRALEMATDKGSRAFLRLTIEEERAQIAQGVPAGPMH